MALELLQSREWRPTVKAMPGRRRGMRFRWARKRIAPAFEAPFLSEIAPEFADEILTALRDAGKPSIAKQVPDLQVVGRCKCTEETCATFFIGYCPSKRFFRSHEAEPDPPLHLKTPSGRFTVDLVNKKISCIELMDRPEIRQALLNNLP